MKRILIWIILIVILAVVLIYFTKYKDKNINNGNNVATDTNIIINNEIESSWIATSSNSYSFKYPENLGTKYINTVNWPPVLNIENKVFTCNERGNSKVLPAGITRTQMINGHNYCVTIEEEGAVGSIYTNYTYAFSYNNQTMTMTFTTRRPQCMNYDDPEQTECKNEQNNFDITNISDIIASNIKKI